MAKLTTSEIKNKILSKFGTNEKVIDTYTSTKDKAIWILWQNEIGEYILNCFLYGYYEEPKGYSINAGVRVYDIKDSMLEKYYMNCSQKNRENKFFVEWFQTRQEIKATAEKMKNLQEGDILLFGDKEEIVIFKKYSDISKTHIIAKYDDFANNIKLTDLKLR